MVELGDGAQGRLVDGHARTLGTHPTAPARTWPDGTAPVRLRWPDGIRSNVRRTGRKPPDQSDHAVSDEGNNVPDTITITDDRTGKTVTVPITGGVFPSSALRELDPSLFMYDPAYLSTAACRSDITYLDGDAGVLRYRGYPIEQLAE